ncbi:MAG TPA: hypothetical protein VHU79_10910 [Sphingomicrobium sp.]|jgi:hypothetical protein|nr:hypothetical protein [Sphingomicrobium sp.]
MVMLSSVVGSAPAAWSRCGVRDFGFAAAGIFTVAFLRGFFAAAFLFCAVFLAVGFSGMGIVIPAMGWPCATAGVATTASASALAAANNFIFTEFS